MHQPTMQAVAKGDKFIGGNHGTAQHGFMYESFVLNVGEMTMRFGKEDRILTVCVRSVGLDGTIRNIIVREKLIWYSDISKGLV